jgi:hypothetical protein
VSAHLAGSLYINNVFQIEAIFAPRLLTRLRYLFARIAIDAFMKFLAARRGVGAKIDALIARYPLAQILCEF